jgi:Icc-related predicted phosphoesterase
MTVKILIMSDLHIEYSPRWSLPEVLPEHDVVVLAGDIDSPPSRAADWASEAFEKPVIYVPGNHEYYGRNINGNDLFWASFSGKRTSVHVLDRHSVVIDGVRFIGATLWTDYYLFGLREEAMSEAAVALNDHRLIMSGAGLKFTPADALERHLGDREFLERELSELFGGPSVVVTHHAPHRGSIEDRFMSDMLSAAFASDLTHIIEKHRPALWLHGHMHHSCDYRVRSTRIVCNPKGFGPRSEGGKPMNVAFCMKIVEV